MGYFDFTGHTADELRAIAAEATRLADIGILPTDPELQPIADLISELAASRKIRNEQVVNSLAEALGIILGNTSAGKKSGRKKSLRDAMKEHLDGPYSNSITTGQIAADYIGRYGEADFAALKMQYSAPKGFKL